MAEIRSHRDLRAWQMAYALGLKVYRFAGSFPGSEKFGLTLQLRRNAVSVSSNIAEGYGRGSTLDYVRFLKIARGSLFEMDTQVQFAVDLGYLNRPEYDAFEVQWSDVSKVLAGLIRSLEPNA
jgi:four helix bundle protein